METNAKRRGPLVEIVLWYLMLIEKDLSIPTLIEHESSSNANRNVQWNLMLIELFLWDPALIESVLWNKMLIEMFL